MESIRDAVSTLGEVPVTTLTLEVVARDTVSLPAFASSTLHGAIGHALQRLDEYADTPAGEGVTANVFEAPAPSAAIPKHLAASATPRLSVVTDLQPRERSLIAGAKLRFRAILLGDDLAWIPPVVSAFRDAAARGLGRGRGACELSTVEDAHGRVWQGDWLRPVKRDPTVDTNALLDMLAARPLEIQTATPLRLTQSGELIQKPRFGDIIGAAARRLAVAQAFFGAGAVDVRLDDIAKSAADVPSQSAHWQPFAMQRYSSRQNKKHPFRGVTGRLTVDLTTGDALPWLGLLLARANRLGIGKGTSFGFGRLELSHPLQEAAPRSEP